MIIPYVDASVSTHPPSSVGAPPALPAAEPDVRGVRAMLPNLYRDYPTAAIASDLEVWMWDRLALQHQLAADPAAVEFGAEGLAYCDFKIGQALAELTRRDALRALRGAPPWPSAHRDYRAEADRLKRAVPLGDFVERYCGVALRRQGKELVGRCPLPGHDDATPSFRVNPDKQVWFCHGCTRGGDLFSLIEHLYGPMPFGEILELIREWSGAAA